MKYFNSFKIFSGKNQVRTSVIIALIAFGALLIGGLLLNVGVPLNDFWLGFVTGLAPFLSGVLVLSVGFGMLNGVFSANMRTAHGYRFFHSLADGAARFRQALLFANVAAFVYGAVYTTLGLLLYRVGAIVAIAAAIFVTQGLMNLTGHMKSPWVRIGVMAAVGFGFGFYSGANGDEGLSFPPDISAIILAASLGFLLISAAVVMTRAEKLWGRED
ncbi:MAG: hypothetical protein NC299_07660 [Lachnospiraceae bacterium]|nr:hypothetical protein [Ruminococcus sp.]MCM1275230.1 hypothetical protein [Lachnospiraceae bacterium]